MQSQQSLQGSLNSSVQQTILGVDVKRPSIFDRVDSGQK